MRVRLLGKDPASQEGQPPHFATDRSDRRTYLVHGWVATDQKALAGVGSIPRGEAVIEICADLLWFAADDGRRTSGS